MFVLRELSNAYGFVTCLSTFPQHKNPNVLVGEAVCGTLAVHSEYSTVEVFVQDMPGKKEHDLPGFKLPWLNVVKLGNTWSEMSSKLSLSVNDVGLPNLDSK